MTEDTNLGNIDKNFDNESNEFNNMKKCKICQVPIYKGQKTANVCLCGEQHEDCLKKQRCDLFSFFECRNCNFRYFIATKKKDINDSYVPYLWMIIFDIIFVIISVIMMFCIFACIYLKVNEITNNNDNPDYKFSRLYDLKCNMLNPLAGYYDLYLSNIIDCSIIHPMIRLVEWFINLYINATYCFLGFNHNFSIDLRDSKYWDIIIIALTFILHSALMLSFQCLFFSSIRRSFYIIKLIINKETEVMYDNPFSKKQD
jgi:hypothetical protein